MTELSEYQSHKQIEDYGQQRMHEAQYSVVEDNTFNTVVDYVILVVIFAPPVMGLLIYLLYRPCHRRRNQQRNGFRPPKTTGEENNFAASQLQ